MKKYSLPNPKPLDVIFANAQPAHLAFELGRHCHEKQNANQELSCVEQTFCWLNEIGGVIAGDGFISVFHQFLTPVAYLQVCEALKEVGASKLLDLISEAWSIYTRSKMPISLDELQAIDVRRFNTTDKMKHFDRIGEKVVSELEEQYELGILWSVEYAKRNRTEFFPMKK